MYQASDDSAHIGGTRGGTRKQYYQVQYVEKPGFSRIRDVQTKNLHVQGRPTIRVPRASE